MVFLAAVEIVAVVRREIEIVEVVQLVGDVGALGDERMRADIEFALERGDVRACAVDRVAARGLRCEL
jgi:hypothetical protein